MFMLFWWVPRKILDKPGKIKLSEIDKKGLGAVAASMSDIKVSFP